MNASLCDVVLSVLGSSGAVSLPQDLVLGYVGPAGVGAVGVLLVVMAVLLIGAVGLVLHPVRLILRRRRRLREAQEHGTQDTLAAEASAQRIQ